MTNRLINPIYALIAVSLLAVAFVLYAPNPTAQPVISLTSTISGRSQLAQVTPAPISFVQSKSLDAGSVSTASLAFNSANTAGNFIVVAVRMGGTGKTVNITDSAGNTNYQL